MAARYLSGVSLKTLSLDYGVAVGTVQKRLDEAGIQRRPRGAPRKPLDRQRLAEQRGSAHSSRRLAGDLGVSRSTVRRRLAELEAPRGSRGA